MTVVFQLPRARPSGEEVFAVGCSPLAEATFSLRVLANPPAYRAHSSWIRSCRYLPRDIRRELRELTPLFAHVLPGYLTATTPASGDYADELGRVAATPPANALTETLTVLERWNAIEERREHPGRVRNARDAATRSESRNRAGELHAQWQSDPRGALERLVDFTDRYWSAAFRSEWLRLSPILVAEKEACAELLRNGRRLAAGSAVQFNDDSITVRRRCQSVDHVQLSGRRITLAPSAFLWPRLSVESSAPWPFALFYPLPKSRPRPSVAEDELLPSLRALADGTRLAIVRLINEQPRSTQELAELVTMSEAAVSQHLRQLRAAGLVITKREGHYVLYSPARASLHRIATAVADLNPDHRHAPE